MTEKQYGGASSFGLKEKKEAAKTIKMEKLPAKTVKAPETSEMPVNINENLVNAGKIASQARAFAVSIAKKGVPLLELAEKIEAKIVELGGKPAFPVNLSINEVAAHDTPAYNDIRTAYGLLKIDLGVHIEGFVADTSVSVDLEDNELNKKLIRTAQDCLDAALKTVNEDIPLGELGTAIEKSAKKEGFLTIRNLSGHSIEQYNLHAGMTIPNYDTKQTLSLGEGVFAIEPFVTNGTGSVRDGKLSGIYKIEKTGSVRDNFAREVLAFIAEEYITLPFCSRWIYKTYGTRGLLALRQIEAAGLLHQYSQLVEHGLGLVAQAEHTVIVEKDKITVTTE